VNSNPNKKTENKWKKTKWHKGEKKRKKNLFDPYTLKIKRTKKPHVENEE